MPTAKYFLGVATAALFTVVTADSAVAQTAGRTRISGLVSGSLSLGNAAPTLGLSASHQFSRWIGVEADFSRFADLTMVEAGSFCDRSGNCDNRSQHAKVRSFTASAVVELPSGGSRVRPYVVVGGGTARVRRDIRGEPTSPFTRTDNWNVVSAGGGIEFLVAPHIAVGIDARFQRILEDPRSFRPNLRDMKRIGTSVSYRF